MAALDYLLLTPRTVYLSGLPIPNVPPITSPGALPPSILNFAGGFNVVYNPTLNSWDITATGTLGTGAIGQGYFTTNTSVSGWAPFSGDVSAGNTALTVGKLTVTGLGGVSLPAPSGSGVGLTYTSGILAWTSLNVSPGTAGQIYITGAGPAVAWVTPSNDLSMSNAGAFSVVQITGPSSGAQPLPIITNETILASSTTYAVPGGVFAASTSTAGAVIIFSFPHPNNAASRWWVSVLGINPSNSTDAYAADETFCYIRTGGAGPIQFGAAPTPLTTFTNGAGSSWGGLTITTSSNNVLVEVTGASATRVDWSVLVQVQQVM